MKKITIMTAVILASIFLFKKNILLKKNDNRIKIKVCKVIEHEALNSVVSGMTDYLMSQKEKEYDVSVETCQGNMALASQIIAKFSDSAADVIVTVGTIPSQAAYKFAKSKNTKVVFSSVTNPKDISENLKNSNITGVSNFVDLQPQLNLFKEIQPNLRRLGIIYNTGEANSVFIVSNLKSICKNMDIKLLEQGISKISEIPQATERLAKSSDAIFISNDNIALSGMENIISICNKNGIPVYVSDTDQVEKGCAAALGPNQYDIGVQTGKIIKRIINGEDINNIEIQYPTTTELYINTKSVIKIPDAIKARAKKAF